jgi:hypothetical protein
MSICASGASTTKAGVPSAVYVDAAFVKSLLPAGWEWLADYSPYMKAIEIGSVSAFCALDPPIFSVPSGSDLYTFVTGGYATQADVVTQFLNNLSRAYLWYNLCQCTSGATPAAPAASAAPAGAPAINPPSVVSGPTVGACATYSGSYSGWAAGSHSYIVLPGPVTEIVGGLVTLPTGAKSIQLDLAAAAGGTGSPTWTLNVSFFDHTGFSGSLGGATASCSAGGSGTTSIDVPATAVYFYIWMEKASTAGVAETNVVTWKATLSCGGYIGQPNSACCPPDTIATGLLNQILTAITLVQRQLAPFAYITGPSHAGLSGNGSFAVAGLLGLKIALTTVPAHMGRAVGTPTHLFDAGWLTVGTADGYGEAHRIGSAADLWFPEDASFVTLVGYTLGPGIVATITELRREA